MPLLVRDLPSSGPEWVALREDAGLTRRDVCELTALHRDTIDALESGRRVARSTRKLVACACGVDVFGHRSEP